MSRILFLSTVSPFDRNSWSGITFHVFQILSEHHKVEWSGAPRFSKWQRVRLRIWRGWQKLHRRRYTDQNLFYSRQLAKWIERRLQTDRFNHLVVGSGEPELVAFLKTRIPITYIADSTFQLKLDYYPWHSDLTPKFINEGNIVERNAIHSASMLIYSSEWAASSAINNYYAEAEKIKVLFFGPGLECIALNEKGIKDDTLDLLFIGRDWIRKGGKVAYQVFRLLKSNNLPCTFTIVGCDPRLENEPGLAIYPNLDINHEEERETLIRLFSSSDLLLLPTFADCTPVVFSEAGAFGIPIITRATGGVESVVTNGKNGIVLPFDSTEDDFFETVRDIWENKSEYLLMCQESRRKSYDLLTWKRWSELFEKL